MTVQELRNVGYKVKVLHHRLYDGVHKWSTHSLKTDWCGPKKPDAKGGSTHIIIDSPNGEHFEGVAICSKKENYDKKLGVRIALGRSGVFNCFKNANAS